jgi:hypothetical protein
MWFNGVRTGFPVTLTAGELIRLKDIPASAEGILAGGSRLHDGMDGEATGEVETRGDGETTKVFTTRSDEDLRCKIKKGDEMIDEETGFKLLDFLRYDYKLTAIVLLVVELSEGLEARDRLLEGIVTPNVRRNVEHFANQLRKVLAMTEEVTGGA